MKEPIDVILRNLQERTKELNCLYRLEELLNDPNKTLDEIFMSIVKLIPCGWQYPELCQAKLFYEGRTYQPPDYKASHISQSAVIIVQGRAVGELEVSYTSEVPQTRGDYFLEEERKLINNIANRISNTILHKKLKNGFDRWEQIKDRIAVEQTGRWRIIIDTLEKSDKNLYDFILRKMLNYLCLNRIEEARLLLQRLSARGKPSSKNLVPDENRPIDKFSIENMMEVSDEILRIASENLSDEQILKCIQKWIQEDKSLFLVKAIENQNSVLSDITGAITRYHYLGYDEIAISPPVEKGLRVTLIRRFFSDQLEFINIAKKYIGLDDYYDIIQRIIFPADSRGKLGGKSAGLFLASHILRGSEEFAELADQIVIPKTWYLTSDGVTSFIHYNNLEDVIEQKFKDIEEIHSEYPNLIQIFKNSHFPPEIVKGLAVAIDDFENHPIIVRSSSLLEDRVGAAFSGKYKSLFLANQGSKEERLEALLDAVAEVYASTFGPDPISYRAEKGLLDYHEEMGIMIQEVVGKRIGNYFLPSFAGVAFSSNEFRWSPRIKREDGLVRLVPGLGTRAVDRVADDYPILVAPGKADLRVNIAPDEILRYSPKKIDVINLESNTFETIEIAPLLREYGNEIPGIHNVVSIFEDNYLKKPSSALNINFDDDTLVVTFDGLITRTPFLTQIKTILNILQQKMARPVDIEFAHDGENLHLLQCRAQSSSKDYLPTPIPKDIPRARILFSANHHVSNGYVPDISHIVYVDPLAYSKLSNIEDLKSVGKAVGKLNTLLPKRQFILMGPGRWGSKGDIKLGVNVTYSDIKNTAVLIEIARKIGNYTPDLSFGTHFFQDLVESSIRYLPLYPDDEESIFSESFLLGAKNIVSDLIPGYESLSDVVRVIDIPQNSDGLILRILMNADLGEAVAYLADPIATINAPVEREENIEMRGSDYWRWRFTMAETIASHLDPERFGVKGFYIFGSTKNATSKPASDIDILIHFNGTALQKEQLLLWLEGWSRALAEINYMRTGYRMDGLLDIHIVTDADIDNKTSYAAKINAITDAAKPLPMKDSSSIQTV